MMCLNSFNFLSLTHSHYLSFLLSFALQRPCVSAEECVRTYIIIYIFLMRQARFEGP